MKQTLTGSCSVVQLLKSVNLFLCSIKDTFELHTPGGGGYGEPNRTASSEHAVEEVPAKRPHLAQSFSARGSVEQYRLAQESA